MAEVAQATLKYKFTEEEGILEVFRDDRKLVLEKLKDVRLNPCKKVSGFKDLGSC